MRHFPSNCLGLLDEDNLVSPTDNFVNVFNSVTSPHVLSYRCILHYFLSMLVGFHFNFTFGLKPQVGGIKIVPHHFPLSLIFLVSVHYLICKGIPDLLVRSFW